MNIDKIEFLAYMDRLLDRFDLLEEKIERLLRKKSCIEGEELLDNQDVLLTLKIADRTLQRFRETNQLPYYKLHGKIYYKLSDVNRFIREIFEAKPGRNAKQRQIPPRNAKKK